jgi:hypothetical protein
MVMKKNRSADKAAAAVTLAAVMMGVVEKSMVLPFAQF